MITTLEHKITRARLLRTAGRRPLLWIAAVAGFLLLVAGGVAFWLWDLRPVVAVLMLISVGLPGALFFLFINYGLSPRCLPMVYPHIVKISNDGIEVNAVVPPIDEDGERRQLRLNISWEDVKSARPTLSALILTLKGRPPGIIILPYEALPDARQDVPDILRQIKNN